MQDRKRANGHAGHRVGYGSETSATCLQEVWRLSGSDGLTDEEIEEIVEREIRTHELAPLGINPNAES
jgi:hypothetical protein